MQIRELIDGIRKLDLVLPEFQREYVWNREQAKQLLVSLLRGYPTGSLLVWKTDSPPDIKNNAVPPDRIGTTSVILDGQQRLTTLYLFTRDEIPPYYREEDIRNDPRGLYYDLATGELQYYMRSLMSGNPTWVAVTSCFDGTQINVIDVAKRTSDDDSGALALAQRYQDHLTALRNILVQDYPVQNVPMDATIADAIDVFDRVNSQGTKLSDAELALAHVTGVWPQARREMKREIDRLAKRRFKFDLTFMTRALVAVVRRRAEYETIHRADRSELEEGWRDVVRILDYLTTMLPKWASVDSTEDLNTTNVLIPALASLKVGDGKFDTERRVRSFVHWLHAASTWARYTSQTDQRLDHDISIVVRSERPWRELVDAIIDQRGRIEVKPSDLEGRGTQHPLYRTAYVLVKSRGAVDWFNGMPLDVKADGTQGIHSHHIFPQSLLYKDGGHDPDNHVHRQIVNEIANRAFLTGSTNMAISNRPPSEYLPEVEARYPGALAKQLVPMDERLWALDRYQDFLAERRKLIASAFNDLMDSLLKEPEPTVELGIRDLVALGEGPTLEFKGSLRWDIDQQQVNKGLQKMVTKTIAAMLNSDGGVLLIGVADSGEILGIEPDLHSMGDGGLDRFRQVIAGLVTDVLGPEFGALCDLDFPNVDGSHIARVRVSASSKPAFHHTQAGSEFFVRVGNTTQPLDPQEAHDYIDMHWAG